MGRVWVAEHTALEVEVAVKFLAPWQFRRDPKALERFRREAAATALVNNPHVLRVFDYGVLDDQTAYIVMELLEGETLGERIARERRLQLSLLVSVVEQAAEALAAAHEKGIVHRDLKPDNVFLCDSRG